MSSEVKPREWEIAKITTEGIDHNSILGDDTADCFSSDGYWVKVIEISAHQALVEKCAALEAQLKTEFADLCKRQRALQAENKILRDAVEHTNEFCLCERFKTMGFDYNEDHKNKGRAKMGGRWLTPRDVAKSALAAINKGEN